MISGFNIMAEDLDNEPKTFVVSIGTLKNIYIYKIGELLKDCTEVKNGRYVIDEELGVRTDAYCPTNY